MHRCNIGQYSTNGRTYKTFFVNIDYGSAWMLFSGALAGDEPSETNAAAKFMGVDVEVPTLQPYQKSRSQLSVTMMDVEWVKEQI